MTSDAEAPTLPSDEAGAVPGGRIGRFELAGVLGRGGMGIVLAARDPELGRDVAIKLLHAGRSDALAREARAMAQLAHPNVATVFEIGEEEGRTFIAMERVDGGTLRGWLAARPRSWREIVSMYEGAGRGLAAVHAAGLVHRDFKPDNVLVGADGRPRVSDFGLVDVVSGAGTPAYMAPEQRAGDETDARADQYSFAIALEEALRPVGAPAWVQAVIARAKRPAPAERWPSMDSMLEALRRDPSVRRTRIAAGVGAAALAGLALWGLLRPTRAGDPCARVGERLAGVWDRARADAIAAKLAAIDPAQGKARFTAVAALLDSYARDWTAMHVDACRTSRGGRSGLYDLRVACLDRRRGELDAVASRLEHATGAEDIDGALQAAYHLDDLQPCADADALLAQGPPASPAVAGLRAEIATAEDAVIAGRLDGEPERSLDLLQRARDSGDAGTLAFALDHRSRVQALRAENDQQLGTVRELTETAARARDDRLAAKAWTTLVALTANTGDPQKAIDLFPAARAAVARIGDDDRDRAVLLYREATALEQTDRRAEAFTELDQAIRLLKARGAERPGSPDQALLSDLYFELGNARSYDGTPVTAVAAYLQSIALLDRAYGPDHPELRYPLTNLAEAQRWLGDYEGALATARRTEEVIASRLGETLALIPILTQEAQELDNLSRAQEGYAPLERALRIARAAPDASQEATVLGALGDLDDELDKLDDAEAHYAASIAILEKLGGQDMTLPIVLQSRAQVEFEKQAYDASIADFRRAIDMLVAWRGPDEYRLVYAYAWLGKVLVIAGKPAEAIAPLEKASALAVPDEAHKMQTLGRFYLGRARYESGRDRRGGLALAREATLELERVGSGGAREARPWLDAH